MERAAKLLKNDKLARNVFGDEELARAVWPSAVGKAIAAHTSRVKLVRDKLVVEVEDAVWQKQLHHLSLQILDRLRRVTGSDAVKELEFRVSVPRRQPQRAESREGAIFDADPSTDEADTIQDPVLKKVYRLSRKKATA